jgi:hypothetical protein
VLQGSGIVSRSREGNFARYEIIDDVVFELCELVCGGLRQQVADLDSLLQAVPPAIGVGS